MTPENEVERALRDWIVRTSGRIDASELTGSTPLVARGILRSVHVMDLILYLEELLGRPIDPDRIAPGSFASIDAIHASFFSTARPLAADRFPEDDHAARSR